MTATPSDDAGKLLPCPFCGSGADTREHPLEGSWSVDCVSCAASMPYVALTEAEAIAAWNARQPISSDEMVERIRASAVRLFGADEIGSRESAAYMRGREDAISSLATLDAQTRPQSPMEDTHD